MKYKLHTIFVIIFSQFLSARMPDAIGYNAVVVSSNEYASNIGLNVLKNGGNAIDAAVAVTIRKQIMKTNVMGNGIFTHARLMHEKVIGQRT